jgi:hypothetical protein
MEWVLKDPQRKHLREIPDYPDCLRVSDSLVEEAPETLRTVLAMIDEVLDAHPDAGAIHVGGDEVDGYIITFSI